ncbi:MAG TPA: TetR/AcrR family transcriptional regulator [Stellaceae bacterium]|nr:TetR/AcrR family transcriptional regulator [Stellaceae bacterium]
MPGPIRNAARTRARILKIATSEFATKSFDGARVDRIAARARVNKHMLYHYFGSKEGLFTAVLEEMYGSIRDSQQEMSLAELPPEEALRQLIVQTHEVILAHPEFIGLLNSENLMKARHIRESAMIRQLYDPLIPGLRAILERGAEAGVFRAGIDPVDLYVSIGSLCFHAISNQHTLKAIFDVDLTSKAALERRLDHVTQMILAYCRAEFGSASQPAPPQRLSAIGN